MDDTSSLIGTTNKQHLIRPKKTRLTSEKDQCTDRFKVNYVYTVQFIKITKRFTPMGVSGRSFFRKQVIRVQKFVGLPPPALELLGVFVRFRRTFAEVITFGGASAHEF